MIISQHLAEVGARLSATSEPLMKCFTLVTQITGLWHQGGYYDVKRVRGVQPGITCLGQDLTSLLRVSTNTVTFVRATKREF